MSELPLINGVLKYIKENNILFCMPGHKGGRGFLNDDEGSVFINNLLKFDMTEVDGLDNFHNAQGIIKEAQCKLKEYYKSKKSYFLVNGSTSGNLIMIFSTFREGDKIIVERNCHRSIYNAIILRKLKPIYIKNNVNPKYNAPLSIDLEHFLCVIRQNKDAKGIVITYPNYYGVCTNLEIIIKEARKYNMKVLVDSAHGAHFGVNELLPKTPLQLGADMVVMSSHKTLPSLTQTAFLHINENVDEEKVDFYVSAFSTTSPSYILMCSMDYARYYIETKGNEDYRRLIQIAELYRNKINKINGFHIINKEDLENEAYDMDKTRYVINLDKGFSGHKLESYLRTQGIQAEMSDSQNVVLILSPFISEKEFKRLYEVLLNCPMETIKDDYKKIANFNIPEMVYTPYEAFNREKIKIKYNNACNKVCGCSIVPYPPGIPLVMPGEIISSDIISAIDYCVENKVTLLGVDENQNIDIIK